MLTLKHRIMLRVYAFWALRMLKRPAVIEAAAMLAFFTGFFIVVSVPSVITNAFHSPNAVRYLASSFFHSTRLAQGLLIASSLAALWLSRNLVPKSALKFRFVRFA